MSGLDGLKRLQTVRFDDETLITPELNVYQPSSTDPPPPSDPPTTTTAAATHTPPATAIPESYGSPQPSTSTATLDDLSIVSSLLGALPDGLTMAGFPDTDI